jgi:hypothetical protein
MPLVIAVWPNNTISIVKMDPGFTAVSLFNELDQIADPSDAKCYVVRPDGYGLCVNFDWPYSSEETVGPKSKGLRLEVHQGKMRTFRWPKTVWRDWVRGIATAARHRDREANASRMSSDEIAEFPAAPTETFTVCQVRKMESFSGVYFAFNSDGSCHYVGEAIDVTARVSKSRPEIGNRMIGVIRCDPHERKRIESYFIGVLDPPGNCQSTQRMRSSVNRSSTKDVRQSDGR